MSQEFAIFSTKGKEPKTQLYAILAEHTDSTTRAEVVARGKHNDLIMAYSLITQALVRDHKFTPADIFAAYMMGISGFEDIEGITEGA